MIAAVALAVTAPFALSGCGTSFGAQTNQQYQAGVGSNLRTGPVGVYNGLFVDNGDGSATFSGALLADEDQTIESVSINGSALKLATPIALTADELTTLGADGEIIVESDDVTEGAYVTISFAATPAGDISLEVPVVARTAEYDGVASSPKKSGGQSDENAEDVDQDATGE